MVRLPSISRYKANARIILFPLLLVLMLVVTMGTGYGEAWCASSTGHQEKRGNFAKNLSKCVKEFPQKAFLDNEILTPDNVYGAEVLELYRRNGFKPVFVSNGRLNENGERLLERINSLVFDGIDVKYYSLNSIHRKIAKIRILNTILDQLKVYISSEPKIFIKRFCPVYCPEYPEIGSRAIRVAFNANDLQEHSRAAHDTCEVFFQVISTANKTLSNLNRTASDLDAALIANAFRMARDMGVENKELVLDALSRDDLDEFFKLIEPQCVHYAPLREALKSLMKKCGEPTEELSLSDKTLRPGKSGREILLIKKRLKVEGFYDGELNSYFDQELKEAVKKFQYAHGLRVDGIIGRETKEALRMPLWQEIEYLKLALSEFREEPLRDLKEGILINIPQFQLELYSNGKIIERHKVIVGKAGGKKKKLEGKLVGINQTPVLESHITRIVFKPRWYVNKRILKELEQESQGDPEYYRRQGFVFLPPRKPGGLPRVYQKPGEKNALGLVKFEFPNRYQVYLHDTPTKHLFSKSTRAFSHGCIRVENALQLARKLLELDGNAAIRSIDKYLKRKNPTYVKLNHPIPIYVRYIPASTDGEGHVIIFKDVYGRFKGKDKVDNKTMICRIEW